jgi:hypothetical protein
MALETGEFLKALGYPTERKALGIVSHGSILNIPHGVEDVKRFFSKTTKKHVKRARELGLESKLQVTMQEMTADVMHVAGERFLVSISQPLGLLLVIHAGSLGAVELGVALQQHFNTL